MNHILEIPPLRHTDDDGGQLRFILKDKSIKSVANKVIKSEDVLLIDFSHDNLKDLRKRYNQIPQDAAQANEKQDPANCAGDGSPLSFWTKLKKAFGFN